MAYIRVINKVSGKTGFLPEENFDPNKYSPVEQPNQAPKTFAQGVGSAIMGLPGALAKPFINTGERVGGAGEALLREFLTSKSVQLQKEGKNDEAIRIGEIAARPSRLTEDEEYRKKLSDPLQIAKDSAAMLSYGVPVGGATSAFGKNIAMNVGKGGLTAGAMGGFGYSDETTPEGLLGSTVLGAGTGFASAKVLNKLFGKGKAPAVADDTTKELSGLEKAGMDLKKNAIRPKAGSGPTSVLDEDEMLRFAQEKGLDKGSPNNMRYKVAAGYQDAYKKVGSTLDNFESEIYDGKIVKEIIESELEASGDNFIPGDKASKALLKRELALLDKNLVDGGLDAKGIHKAIGDLNGKLGPAFTKLSEGKPLTPVEGIRMDVNKVLHNMLEEAGPAELKTLTREMSMYHKLSPGLKSASMESANLFGVPVYGPGQGVLTAENKLGDIALGAGKFMREGFSAKVPEVVSKNVPTRGPAALTAFMTGGSQPTPQTPSQGYQAPTQYAPQEEMDLGLSKEDIALIQLLPAKQQANVLEKIITDRLTKSKKEPTETEVARKSTQKLAQEALAMLDSGSIKTGFIAGPVESLKAKVGAADPATLDFNVKISNLIATIAKQRGGTSFTPSEKEMLERYAPKVGDSAQELKVKLTNLLSSVDF